jgi:CRP-like cAMP-binding protein
MASATSSSTQNRLLAALPPAELERYFSELRPVSLAQRQVLYEPGTPLTHVYFIKEGIVSILTKMADATTIEVGMIGIEGAVGTAALLGGEASSQQALVQVSGSALRMNAAECKAAFDQSPAVRAVMMRFVEALFDLSAQTAACNRLHTIEQRCARWLLMAHDRLQDDIMPMTHEFLASMLGVRRAGVTETAGELQRSGLIHYHHGRLTIVDREGLEATACECYRIDHDLFMPPSMMPGVRLAGKKFDDLS